jgi:hypothetical protein
MRATPVTALTREVTPARDRRASLTALGAAALAGILMKPLAADAKLSAAEKCKRRCRRQELRCEEAVAARCGSQECEDTFRPCCTFLRTCSTSGLMNCLFDAL